MRKTRFTDEQMVAIIRETDRDGDFARVAQAIGFEARRVERAEDLDAAVRDWIAAPRPALLDVVTDRMELVMPPKIEVAQVFGTALYSAKAVLAGRVGDVWELVTDNLP